MTQYVSGDEVTERENLLDTITVRAPFMTPMLRQLPQETVPNIVHEWSIDDAGVTSASRSISAPHADAKREGADFTYSTPTYPTRLRCVSEIKHRGMEMSGSARPQDIAGMSSSWDYRVGRMATDFFNSFDNTFLYGQGSPETAGTTDERRLQGLIHWAAWTGLERAAGSALNAVTDPYGITIASQYWSWFYNANHAPLTQDMFYNQIMVPLLAAGADMESSHWKFWGGYRMMGKIARFIIADGAIPLNERTRSADDGMGSDFLNVFRFPSGHIVEFRTNHWLNNSASTYTVDNSDFTPGAPASPGTVGSTTFYGDQTIIGYEPGTVAIVWYRNPGFKDISTAGDYSRIAMVGEGSLRVRHPLCVGGGGNLGN